MVAGYQKPGRVLLRTTFQPGDAKMASRVMDRGGGRDRDWVIYAHDTQRLAGSPV